MKILLVDDNPDDLRLGRHQLSQLGYAVVTAENGTQALTLFEREQPEVLITDLYMPGMDGFALARAAQQRAAPRWQPVIFLSGHSDEELQVRALETGADAYFVKPVPTAVFGAKLQAIQRLISLQRQAEGRMHELERLYGVQEEEKRIARHLLERMVDAEKLADPALRHWLAPAANFSGDLVAAARTPGGVLHVLLANGRNCGLTSSLTVLPITPVFYRMTEKGFGIDAIAREMNAKTRHFLPADRFIAATLAAVDPREGIVQVWNGGNPEPCLLDAVGHATWVFSREQEALGVLDDAIFDGTPEAQVFSEGHQLVMYSDGLLEAESRGGELFGHERLARTLVNTSGSQRLAGIISAVSSHLGGALPKDDISIVLVDHHLPPAPANKAEPATPASGAKVVGNWRFSISLGAQELQTLDLVPLLLGLVDQINGTGTGAGQLFVVLSELFNNALDHGLLRLDSRLKRAPDGMEAWLRERQSRLTQLADGRIEFALERVEDGERRWLRVDCRDSGPGFDPAALAVPAAADMPFGRGIALVRSLCDDIRYNKEGNAVSVLLALDTADSRG